MSAQKQRQYPSILVIVAVSIWVTVTGNFAFFSNLFAIYPVSWKNAGFISSLVILLIALTNILISTFAIGRLYKPLLMIVLLVSTASAYFMDTYNVVISSEILQSALQTDASESLGLLNARLFIYLVFSGVLPCTLLWFMPVSKQAVIREALSRGKLIVLSGAAIILMLFLFSSSYASFFREHKSVRFYSNPETPVYTAIKYVQGKLEDSDDTSFKKIGLDARQEVSDRKRRLIILVVGETARWDHFSLNGYTKITNPMLAERNVFSFDNVWSCGTATAVSVPCMFSLLDRKNYREKVAKSTDNVLDIAERAGINVAWMDNNSDSKGVALRVPYTSYRTPELNPYCDDECRDIGMLEGVRKLVSASLSGDILVVLHQMGSHGPEYAKRYPKSFERFKPSCSSNLLEKCSQEEIDNAYDNSILYTDFFLGHVIDYLRSVSMEFSPAMLYVSDHGESLGENGIFLHGFPYAFAPESQKHIPMIFWAGNEFGREHRKLKEQGFEHREFTQDNLFHTLLGLLDVKTEVYQPKLDIFYP
ncbi:phosphoethanolamine--lipid A transferase [Microbulbifer bruguierae]|uniref:Phosphoethanolamine--lipid A transferase n=1 Tax=Microbulbifer bruguierae TaxID=3029061 RepID=A0ABY8NDA0_9GAMM|nr:phosphoethanolamine--lipid A transferase [Microbulbifer bruguierae]WGL16901.1 phosphoethanolamine--lipid A transferase [Microbulbifer bruguierae]